MNACEVLGAGGTDSVKHPGCGGRTDVIDSRPVGKAIYRRRVCRVCKVRFTTYEVAFRRPPHSGGS